MELFDTMGFDDHELRSVARYESIESCVIKR
jgi:hypothetical protein